MKITHICLCGPVTDGYSYQENLLSKYHVKINNEVSLITSKWVWTENGELIKSNKTHYTNEDNVKMFRLEVVGKDNITKKIKKFKKLYSTLELTSPDIIFIHGVQFVDIRVVVKYKRKNPDVRILIDNHADSANSATNWISKYFLHKIVWKKYAKLIEPYTEKFYGVLPSRVKFLNSMYDIPSEKIDLLIMGADDEIVKKASTSISKSQTREYFKIEKDDFLIVTGGKIDFRKQTDLLLKAVKNINNTKIKLIFFGPIVKELKIEINELIKNNHVTYIEWLTIEESYQLFAIADLVVFPGTHSVYWEQAAALGKPLMVKYWDGITHLDYNGNLIYLYNDSVEEIEENINYYFDNKEIFDQMKIRADKVKNEFLYSKIAEKSLNNRGGN